LAPVNYGISSEIATEQAYQLLTDFGLADVVNRSVHELSGGQKRLAALASVLALEPTVLILDEPTNGLDPWWRRHLAQLLPQLPVQVLLIASHDLHWVSRVAERAMVLQDGKIKVDMPQKIYYEIKRHWMLVVYPLIINKINRSIPQHL
jgi:cobalt/nickel transport system ATP-binding protein